jgi:hypothetical protein
MSRMAARSSSPSKEGFLLRNPVPAPLLGHGVLGESHHVELHRLRLHGRLGGGGLAAAVLLTAGLLVLVLLSGGRGGEASSASRTGTCRGDRSGSGTVFLRRAGASPTTARPCSLRRGAERDLARFLRRRTPRDPSNGEQGQARRPRGDNDRSGGRRGRRDLLGGRRTAGNRKVVSLICPNLNRLE